MTDELDNPAESPQPPEPQGPRGGELLAEARRQQQISVLEIAKELHLDEPKVRALERNDFEMLGAPVFAKGHLRKYAQLVGVNPDDVLEDYYKMTRQEAMPPIVVARRRVRQEVSPGPWIAAIIIIIVAAAAYWWFAVYTGHPVAPAATPRSSAARPPETARDAAVDDVATGAEIAAGESAYPSADDGATIVPVPAETMPANGEVRLSLSYSGDCWTEISDATGRRLFFDMGHAGRNLELNGVPPFAVLFGNVDNVAVRINGNDYPLSSSNPGSRMARLSIAWP